MKDASYQRHDIYMPYLFTTAARFRSFFLLIFISWRTSGLWGLVVSLQCGLVAFGWYFDAKLLLLYSTCNKVHHWWLSSLVKAENLRLWLTTCFEHWFGSKNHYFMILLYPVPAWIGVGKLWVTDHVSIKMECINTPISIRVLKNDVTNIWIFEILC